MSARLVVKTGHGPSLHHVLLLPRLHSLLGAGAWIAGRMCGGCIELPLLLLYFDQRVSESEVSESVSSMASVKPFLD